MSEISLSNVSKHFGAAGAVLDVTLTVRDGEFFSLLGPSGSGKTTLLRMIAGFVRPSAGSVLVGGKSMAGIPPEQRDIGFVFQDYALFPHLSVFENVAFGLRARKVRRPEIAARVGDVLGVVGLGTRPERRVTELSGGERQRVAIARAIVIRPKVLLLDEPLGALDRLMREEMQFQLKDLQATLGITTIYVTHDQTEALTMSDRIGVMHGGKLHEVGDPRSLYQVPRERFTSRFMGENNFLSVRVAQAKPGWTILELPGGTLRLDGPAVAAEGKSVLIAVRPEDVRLESSAEESAARGLKGQVTGSAFRGSVMRYRVMTQAAGELIVDVPGRSAPVSRGAWVDLSWDASRCVALRDDPDGGAEPSPDPSAEGHDQPAASTQAPAPALGETGGL